MRGDIDAVRVFSIIGRDGVCRGGGAVTFQQYALAGDFNADPYGRWNYHQALNVWC